MAGKVESVSLDPRVGVGPDAVVLDAPLVVDRRRFAINRSPLKMAVCDATGHVVARFVRT